MEARKADDSPTAVEAEHQVAGSCLLDFRLSHSADVAALCASDFVDQYAWQVLQTVRACYGDGTAKKPDSAFMKRLEAQTGAPVDMAHVGKMTSKAIVAHCDYNAGIVKETGERRQQWEFAERLHRSVRSDFVSAAEIAEMIEGQAQAQQTVAAAGWKLPTFRNLQSSAGGLKPVVVDGMLRRGDVGNFISGSKANKSWACANLALTTSLGGHWLGFRVVQGRTLVIDTELPSGVIAHRYPTIAREMGLEYHEWADSVCIESLRGQLADIYTLDKYFARIPRGTYDLVLLDSIYKLYPEGFNENDAAHVTRLYNQVFAYAERLDAAFLCTVHSTKGNQSGKSVADTGSGSGAMARSVDAHCVLRAHEQPGCMVFETILRAFPPMPAVALRWNFPLWRIDDQLDPTALAAERPRRPRPPKPDEPPEITYTQDSFAAEFLTGEPQGREALILAAVAKGVKNRTAERLVRAVISNGKLCHVWKDSSDKRVKLYANTPQPSIIPPESLMENVSQVKPKPPKKAKKPPRKKAG